MLMCKKALCFLLILPLLSLLLAGCVNKEVDTPKDAQTATVLPLQSAAPPSTAAKATPTPNKPADTATPDTAKSAAPPSAKATGGLSNTTKGWGFKKEPGKKPEMPKATVELFAKYATIYAGNASGGDRKSLYLTFDEGYENGYTAPILDVLKSHNVPAAFFVTGPYLEQQQELILRMVNEGHIVGNHTVNHPSMPSVTSDSKLEEELLALDRKFKQMTGLSMNYIRPPKGEYSERTLALSHRLGYKTVLWSFAYVDWQTDQQKGADHAYNQVMPYLHDGAILLLHAVSKDNAEALDKILTDAKKQGYVFRSLDEL